MAFTRIINWQLALIVKLQLEKDGIQKQEQA
jgi:hypothetical protein